MPTSRRTSTSTRTSFALHLILNSTSRNGTLTSKGRIQKTSTVAVGTTARSVSTQSPLYPKFANTSTRRTPKSWRMVYGGASGTNAGRRTRWSIRVLRSMLGIVILELEKPHAPRAIKRFLPWMRWRGISLWTVRDQRQQPEVSRAFLISRCTNSDERSHIQTWPNLCFCVSYFFIFYCNIWPWAGSRLLVYIYIITINWPLRMRTTFIFAFFFFSYSVDLISRCTNMWFICRWCEHVPMNCLYRLETSTWGKWKNKCPREDSSLRLHGFVA